MARPVISLVLPIYNEEEVIPELHTQLQAFLEKLKLDTEVIFVNDGSNDLSLQILRGVAVAEPRYRVLSFARNFGHQTAVTAGLDYARGQAVVVMDADLQDPPEVVLEMVKKWREGYDVVYGQRRSRVGETAFKLFTAKVFYRIFAKMIPIEVPLDTGDFRLMSRRVVVALRALRESHRFVRGLVSWIGFKQTAVAYDRPGRFAGETKYPLRKMLRFAIDGITSFSTLPLRLATYLGFFISFMSILVALWAVFVHSVLDSTVPGWTAQVVITSLLASVQLVMIGILGEYIGRIYEQVKLRPLYIVGDRVNLGDRDDDTLDDVMPPQFDVRASVPPKTGTMMGLAAPGQPPLVTAPMTAVPAIPKAPPLPSKTAAMHAVGAPPSSGSPRASGSPASERPRVERPVTQSFPPSSPPRPKTVTSAPPPPPPPLPLPPPIMPAPPPSGRSGPASTPAVPPRKD